MLLLSDSRTLAERNLPGGRHLLPLVDNSRQAAALPGTPAHRISQFCKKYFWKLQSSKVLPGWAGEPSPYQQPYQLLRKCHSPPSIKIICHPNPKSAISPSSIKGISDDEQKSVKAHLLVSEPGSLDSIGSNEEGGADDDGTGRDKWPEVLAHQPVQESRSRSSFTGFQ